MLELINEYIARCFESSCENIDLKASFSEKYNLLFDIECPVNVHRDWVKSLEVF